MTGPPRWTRAGQDRRDNEHAAEQDETHDYRRMEEHRSRWLVYLNLAVLLVAAVTTIGIVAHFNDDSAQFRKVNARQDAREVAQCERVNRLKTIEHHDASTERDGGHLSLAEVERIAPIVACPSGVPLPVRAQREYVARLLSLPKGSP